MSKKSVLILIMAVWAAVGAQPQGIKAGPLYQILLLNNPGLSGSEGDGILRIAYVNHYPGNHLNLNSGYLSYDSYFGQLHGGASVFLSEDYLGGIINDLAGGFSYAYFLKAGKDLFINAGLSASVFHRGYNFGSAVLPDQIDPMGGITLPPGEILDARGKTMLDLGAGFVVSSGLLSGGFGVNHLAEPVVSTSAISSERIRRRYTAHFSGDFKLNTSHDIRVEPIFLTVIQGDYFSVEGGASLASDHFAVNTVVSADNGASMNIQAGFAVSFSIVGLFYNYRFNAVTGNELLPISLLHQVGISISLNNVEKRKAFRTINFPKM
jgi:type IX secretion system PorP/SprF family membrane protein